MVLCLCLGLWGVLLVRMCAWCVVGFGIHCVLFACCLVTEHLFVLFVLRWLWLFDDGSFCTLDVGAYCRVHWCT